MECPVITGVWIVAVFLTLVTIPSSHATIQRPQGMVNEPQETGEAIPGGDIVPAESEVIPVEGQIIPGSQLEGENLVHNPNPQSAGGNPSEEANIDPPVGNVNNVESPDQGIHEAPRGVSVTDNPQIGSGGTLSISPLKPTRSRILVVPTPPSNTSEVRNSSEVTTGDVTNSSLERPSTGEEVLERRRLAEITTHVNLQTSMSTSSSVPMDRDQIVPTRVIIAESTTVGSNNSDVQIPLPDSNLRLTSRPIVEETDTVSETVTHVDSSMNQVTHLESSEHVVVESRIVPGVTLLVTMSLNRNSYTSSSHQSTDGNSSRVLTELTFVTSVTSVYLEETDTTLSSKDRKAQNKPPKSTLTVSAEQTETPSSVVLSRSTFSEQTLSIQEITPTSTVVTAESTSSSSVSSSIIAPTSSVVVTQSVTSSPTPAELTLPSGSHEIVIQKNTTLSVVGTTSPSSVGSTTSTSTSTSSVPSTASASIDTTVSSKSPTTKQSTTPHPSTSLMTLFRNASASTGTISRTSTSAPYTGDVTLTMPVTTTMRKNKPYRTTTVVSSSNTSNSNETFTESPTTNNSDTDNRKKTVIPTPANTTTPPRTTEVTTLSTLSSSQNPVTTRSTTPEFMTRRPVTHPTTKPPVFAQVKLQMSWRDFCAREDLFKTDLQDIFHVEGGHNVSTEQIMFMDIHIRACVDLYAADLPNVIQFSFYLVDVTGNYDEILTMDCAKVVKRGYNRKVESYFYSKLVEVKLNTDENPTTRPPIETKPVEKGKESLFAMEPGITIAIVIASVGGVCCIVLIILQVLMRQRNKRLYLPDTRHHSFTSMDSMAMNSVTKSRPNSGLFNPGLEQAELAEPLYPVNFAGLANRCLEPEIMKEEFQIVPNHTPKLSTVPVGAEDKNRYANVIPVPQTRVKLKRRASQVTSDYINANYITGYGDDKQAYIATQAPLDRTVADFWRMVWEQQSRVIIMLTAIEENGHPKCTHYWPDCLGDSMQRYGDFMIHLKKKDVHQEYIVSILELKDIENNLVREIKHCWYTCWPVNGTPEPISLVKFILDTRVFYEDSGAPLVVHCSPGTGRTGTLIATDVCMRQYENRRIVDVLNTVYRMRQERAGSVQTKEQYMLIYNALNEYASVLRSPAISTSSSSMTLHNMV